MLVLKTTSPRASPCAPAATPRYQVPSSRASMAFMRLPMVVDRRSSFVVRRFVVRRAFTNYELRTTSPLQGCRDACARSGGEVDGSHPPLMTGQRNPHGVCTGGHGREDQRRRADEPAVHKHLRARGPGHDM